MEEGQSQSSVRPGARAVARAEQQLCVRGHAHAGRAPIVPARQRDGEAALPSGAPGDDELRTPKGAVRQHDRRTDACFSRAEGLRTRRSGPESRAGGEGGGTREPSSEARRRR